MEQRELGERLAELVPLAGQVGSKFSSIHLQTVGCTLLRRCCGAGRWSSGNRATARLCGRCMRGGLAGHLGQLPRAACFTPATIAVRSQLLPL